jgi:hypothetical protein
VLTRSIDRSNDSTEPTPVVSACATRYASAKSKRSTSYTSKGAAERWAVDGLDGWQRNRRAHQIGDFVACDLVERFKHVDALGDDQVGEQQLLGRAQRDGGASRHFRRIAGEVTDQNIRIDERAQRRRPARATSSVWAQQSRYVRGFRILSWTLAAAPARRQAAVQTDVRLPRRKLALTIAMVGRGYRGVFEAIGIGGAIGGWLRW